jgi:hypothetical protein
MDTLYGTVGSPRFRGDLSQVVTDSRVWKGYQTEILFACRRIGSVPEDPDVMESLLAFASAVRSVDTTDAFAIRAVSHVGKASLAVDHLSMSPCFPSWLLVRKKSIG